MPAPRPYPRGSREYRRITLALFGAGFATFALVFAPQAMLPGVAAELGVDAAQAVLLVSCASLGMAAAVIPWSFVADRIGRSRAMRWALLGSAAISLAIPLIPGYAGVLSGRVLLGAVLAAVPALGVAYVLENMSRADAIVAAGVFVSGNTFGGICGRLVGGPLADAMGWRVALAATAALAAVPALAALILLPPSPRSRPASSIAQGLRSLAAHLGTPRMLVIYAQGFLVMGSFGIVYNLLAFRLIAAPFDVPAAAVSLIFLAYLAGTATSRVAGRLALRWGPRRAILVGLGVLCVGALLLVATQLWIVIAGLVVFTIGCFLAHPVASALSGERAETGVTQSTALYQLSWLGGTAVLGWVGGVLADAGGWPLAVGAVLVAAALAAAAALAIRR